MFGQRAVDKRKGGLRCENFQRCSQVLLDADRLDSDRTRFPLNRWVWVGSIVLLISVMRYDDKLTVLKPAKLTLVRTTPHVDELYQFGDEVSPRRLSEERSQRALLGRCEKVFVKECSARFGQPTDRSTDRRFCTQIRYISTRFGDSQLRNKLCHGSEVDLRHIDLDFSMYWLKIRVIISSILDTSSGFLDFGTLDELWHLQTTFGAFDLNLAR